MSNIYILPAVVFALVPGIGTVVSRRTAPPSRSIANASVANVAAASRPTAAHNNVLFLSIASLPCFFLPSRGFRLRDIFPLLEQGFNQRFIAGKYFSEIGT